MFKKIINWWRYKKVFNEEYSKIKFNCFNCRFFKLYHNQNCVLYDKYIKNYEYCICNRFEVSKFRIDEVKKIALLKTSDFRELNK